MTRKPIYALDFDGTIVDRSGVPTNSDVWMDPPKEDVIDVLWWMVKEDINFYIFTNRTEEEWSKIRDWLLRNDFTAFTNKDKPLNTNIKQPGTTIYLDDRALRFTSWNDFRKLIL